MGKGSKWFVVSYKVLVGPDESDIVRARQDMSLKTDTKGKSVCVRTFRRAVRFAGRGVNVIVVAGLEKRDHFTVSL